MRGILTVFLMVLATALAAVEVGMARVNVLQELGPPAAAMKRGDTETLNYKNGVRIKLVAGRVVEISGQTPTAVAEAPPAGAGSVAAEAPPPEEEPAEPELTKEQAGELDKLEKEMAESDAKARAEMEQAIMAMENIRETEPEAPSFNVAAFLLELGVKWLMTLAALKLACKYWNSDVPWRGLMLVAVVDVAVRGAIGYIGYAVLEMMSLFYADEAVAALVMVGLLRKVSINQRLALAIEVVLTTKVFSIVVGSFVVTVLMRTMF